MSTEKKTEKIELRDEDLDAMLDRLRRGETTPEDVKAFTALVATVRRLWQALESARGVIRRFLNRLFGLKTEKTEEVLAAAEKKKPPREEKPKKKPKGHGRNGANAFPGATRIFVQHDSLVAGTRCPCCERGTLYEYEPGKEPRFSARPPITLTLYETEKFRCNTCGEIFEAKMPPEAGTEKYDEKARAMVVILKYGTGMPFNRMEALQESLEIPLPASTQWDLANETAEPVFPVYEAIVDQAAQDEVLHNDDTGMKVIEVKREDGSKRTGTFTSAIVSTADGRDIALFFTGPKHAGENLSAVLKRRLPERGPPIQMCDALKQNLPKGYETVLANCLAHARRKFVEVAPVFPAECRVVLEKLRDVYHNDDLAREQGLSPAERLELHKEKSAPLMADLEKWLREQFDKKLVEPSSSLGKAISYMLNHWGPLTLFLRVAGAPLDNNLCERCLKMAIRHRKNSLFYKTEKGAAVGDMFMTIIHTCRLNEVNPFDYLVALQKHRDRVAKDPRAWLPWNYKAALQPVVAN